MVAEITLTVGPTLIVATVIGVVLVRIRGGELWSGAARINMCVCGTFVTDVYYIRSAAQPTGF